MEVEGSAGGGDGSAVAGGEGRSSGWGRAPVVLREKEKGRRSGVREKTERGVRRTRAREGLV